MHLCAREHVGRGSLHGADLFPRFQFRASMVLARELTTWLSNGQAASEGSPNQQQHSIFIHRNTDCSWAHYCATLSLSSIKRPIPKDNQSTGNKVLEDCCLKVGSGDQCKAFIGQTSHFKSYSEFNRMLLPLNANYVIQSVTSLKPIIHNWVICWWLERERHFIKCWPIANKQVTLDGLLIATDQWFAQADKTMKFRSCSSASQLSHSDNWWITLSQHFIMWPMLDQRTYQVDRTLGLCSPQSSPTFPVRFCWLLRSTRSRFPDMMPSSWCQWCSMTGSIAGPTGSWCFNYKGTPTWRGLFQSDGKRPEVSTLAPWMAGKYLAWDTTVVHTCTASAAS